MHEISISAEKVFDVMGFPVTNALLLSFVTVFILLGLAVLVRRKISLVPGKIQSVFELFMEELLSIMDSVLGKRSISEKYFPLIATIFLFILVSNWLGLFPLGALEIKLPEEQVKAVVIAETAPPGPEPVLPPDESQPPVPEEAGEGQVTPEGGEVLPLEEKIEHYVPLFRAPAADLNFTIALAIISVFGVNFFGVTAIGFYRHFNKFFTLKNPIFTFVGLLEFVAEFVKIISFSFRLFGNVFAGEVLLMIVGFLVPYILPLPFLALEIFVGFIQAFIFSMLTMVFVAMAVAEPSH